MSTSSFTKFECCGIQVRFPYQPYDTQKKYMENVITCLNRAFGMTKVINLAENSTDPSNSSNQMTINLSQNFPNSNALLESPTGTGKTLCLFCATLAWLHNFKNVARATNWQGRQPKVFYCLRTHSQINQAMSELKKCALLYEFPAVTVLGSREHLCIKRRKDCESCLAEKGSFAQLTGGILNKACQKLVDGKKCDFLSNMKKATDPKSSSSFSDISYFMNDFRARRKAKLDQKPIEKPKSKNVIDLDEDLQVESSENQQDDDSYDLRSKNVPPPIPEERVFDVEELVEIGNTCEMCPYFLARDYVTIFSDIICTPYNYILDPSTRRTVVSSKKKMLENGIVIFDEAHNVEAVCEDALSFILQGSIVAETYVELEFYERLLKFYEPVDECDYSQVFQHLGGVKKQVSKFWELLSNFMQMIENNAKNSKKYDEGLPIGIRTCLETITHAFGVHNIGQLAYIGETMDYIIGCMQQTFEKLTELQEKMTGDANEVQNQFFKDFIAGKKKSMYKGLKKLKDWFDNMLSIEESEIKRANPGFSVKNNQKEDAEINEDVQNSNFQQYLSRSFKTIEENYRCFSKINSNPKRKRMKPQKMKFLERIVSEDVAKYEESVDINTSKQLEDQISKRKKWLDQDLIINWWCFCPGLALNELIGEKVKSFIFTSGTLAPFEGYESDYKINFPISFQGSCVVPPDHLSCFVVPSGPKGIVYDGRFSNRSSSDYQQEVGRGIMNIANICPNGLLVFFPSFTVMEIMINKWKNTPFTKATDPDVFDKIEETTKFPSNLYEAINSFKPIFTEPQGNVAAMKNVMINYENLIYSGSRKGAVLLAVCRGKISEGLDFSDRMARCVIVVGLPYPPTSDPKINQKTTHFDQKLQKKDKESKRPSANSSTSNSWYQNACFRSVNQAIGRIIRHSKDFGAIALFDTRYGQTRRMLPKWITETQGVVKAEQNFSNTLGKMRNFFKNTITKYEKDEKPRKSLQIHVTNEEFEDFSFNSPLSSSLSASLSTEISGNTNVQDPNVTVLINNTMAGYSTLKPNQNQLNQLHPQNVKIENLDNIGRKSFVKSNNFNSILNKGAKSLSEIPKTTSNCVNFVPIPVQPLPKKNNLPKPHEKENETSEEDGHKEIKNHENMQKKTEIDDKLTEDDDFLLEYDPLKGQKKKISDQNNVVVQKKDNFQNLTSNQQKPAIFDPKPVKNSIFGPQNQKKNEQKPESIQNNAQNIENKNQSPQKSGRASIQLHKIQKNPQTQHESSNPSLFPTQNPKKTELFSNHQNQIPNSHEIPKIEQNPQESSKNPSNSTEISKNPIKIEQNPSNSKDPPKSSDQTQNEIEVTQHYQVLIDGLKDDTEAIANFLRTLKLFTICETPHQHKKLAMKIGDILWPHPAVFESFVTVFLSDQTQTTVRNYFSNREEKLKIRQEKMKAQNQEESEEMEDKKKRKSEDVLKENDLAPKRRRLEGK